MRKLFVKKFNNAFVGFIAGVLVSLFYISFKGSQHDPIQSPQHEVTTTPTPPPTTTPKCAEDLSIVINGNTTENGLRRGKNIYFPWDWMKSYFDVYGKYDDRSGEFGFHHSYSKTDYLGDTPYTPTSAFIHFANFQVEGRDRVKVVSGVMGVPISTQWSAAGYFYPIQIAQFALSKYSKNITDKSENKIVYLHENKSRFSSGCKFLNSDPEDGPIVGWTSSKICEIKIDNIEIDLDKLQMDFHLDVGAKIDVHVTSNNDNRKYILRYLASPVPAEAPQIDYDSSSRIITIGVGNRVNRSILCRNLKMDLYKGFGYRSGSKNVKKTTIKLAKIIKINLVGNGRAYSITLANKRNEANFYAASLWLVHEQKPDGKWPIDVTRSVPGYPDIAPGWCSAMAQGQGISVLVRAGELTGDSRFWTTAEKALNPFTLNATDGGVRAYFLDKYVWYEEYPVEKGGLFVLNGFLYSLIGLYDLSAAPNAPQNAKLRAKQLFEDGLRSLLALLPLYDTGHGSVYDLGHVVLKKPPNLARWDYHTTHIQQLRLFSSILPEHKIFHDFAARWTGYMTGQWAPHN